MKYVFIDTNQYRHLFSRKEGFSENLYNFLFTLSKLGYIKLVLPQQTRDEVERGRFRQWYEEEVASIKKEKEILEKEKELREIQMLYFGEKSKAVIRWEKLSKTAVVIPETNEIIERARIRKEKGNPPYDSGLGDVLIWESLLDFLREESKKGEEIDLIFISNDKKAWGEEHFDRYLEKEYKDQVGGRIFYSNKLSDLPKFLKEEAYAFTEKIRKEIERLRKEIKKVELEEAKRISIINFIASPSFVEAGERAQKLLQYKDKLTVKDYDTIIRGSLENPQIFESFFTAQPLNELVRGEGEYVKEEVEKIDKELWEKFSKQFKITFLRKSDQQREIDTGNLKNVSF